MMMEIAGKKIDANHPCFIIAEAGVNHNGSAELARRLVEAAAETGADAVKFQTWKTDQVIAPNATKAEYQLRFTDPEQSQADMVRPLELSADTHRDLAAYCRTRGILFLSTPFDEGSVDLLDQLGVPAFKVGSGEITNIAFLEYIAGKRDRKS